MPVMLKRGAVQTGVPWLDALNSPEPEQAPLPPDASLWQRAKRGLSDAMSDPGGEIIGMANPMEVASLAPVAISLVRRAGPKVLRSKLTMEIPEGITDAARKGLGYVQDALYQLAESHPRTMSHFRKVTARGAEANPYLGGGGEVATAHFDPRGLEYTVRNKGLQQAKDRATAAGGAFDLNFNPEKIAQSVTDLPTAMRLVGHEVGGHAVQNLSDPSRAHSAYEALTKSHGYRSRLTGRMTHPSEILSESAGWKRAGRTPEWGSGVTPFVSKSDFRDASLRQLVTRENPVEEARRAWKVAREAIDRKGVPTGGWTPTR
jgi:hypothetical protein